MRTTWTGSAVPPSWMDLTPRVNTSLGGQSANYPIGYRPTIFEFLDGGDRLMARDWRPEIVRMVQVKQAIFEADAAGIWEFHLPRVAATPEDLAQVEEALGFRLDPDYREFLSYANGWPSFFQSVDLFGTDDLVEGPRMDIARQMLTAVEPIVLERAGLDKVQVIPVAASTVDLDLFVMAVIDGQQEPPVVWLAGHEIDRFRTFEDYILAMIDYNARELAVLTGG